jgi:phosphatidylglycerol:prolipoprotein diacylglycerol transferase
MFPTLNYFFKYLFGWDWGMNFPPSFGFLVALSFLCAAWVLSKELKRKEKLGIIHSVKRKVKIGEKASTTDLISYGLFGFVVGFKVLGMILGDPGFKHNAQNYILSTQGNLLGGIIGAALFAGYIYWDKKRKSLPQPKEVEIDVHPYQLVGNITFYAAISGIIGAKIFHQLEYWDNFVADPIGNLFSASGLTFYGGLIGGFAGVWYYIRKNKFPLMIVADAVAPGLILAYAVGRLGCMCSGDGDWGIINSAYRVSDDNKYSVVSPEAIQHDLYDLDSLTGKSNAEIFGGNGQPVSYSYYPKPKALSFLPTWLFAFDFPHNVNEEGIPIKKGYDKIPTGPDVQYSKRLPLPVFPTPVYETLMGFVIFFVLWGIRKRIKVPGVLFCIYLILNGIERLLIEQVRVNSEFPLLGLKVSQAEIIAVVIMLVGLLGIYPMIRFKDKLIKL